MSKIIILFVLQVFLYMKDIKVYGVQLEINFDYIITNKIITL